MSYGIATGFQMLRSRNNPGVHPGLLALQHAILRLMKFITTADVPANPLYSQAIKVGPNIYMSGVAGISPETNTVAGPTIQEQTRQALINCENILRAAGATLGNTVEVQILLANPGDFTGLNEEYARFFKEDPPVRSVARLGPEIAGVLVSIKMLAVLPD